MSQAVDDLWMVAGGLPHVDANALAAAVESAVRSPEILDYRTRLLVRDSLHALRAHWGDSRFQAWLDRSPVRAEIEAAADPSYFDPDPDEIGFPSLERRVMDVIHPDQVQRFLRDLSARLTRPTRLVIGGSIALILSGALIRYTDDIDVVDEVP